MLASKQSDDAEILWLMSLDSFPFQKVLRETFVCYHRFIFYMS